MWKVWATMADAVQVQRARERDRREKARLKKGQLDGLGRIITFAPMVRSGSDNWVMFDVDALETLPPGIVASKGLNRAERQVEHRMTSSRGMDWTACIFTRVERGSLDSYTFGACFFELLSTLKRNF